MMILIVIDIGASVLQVLCYRSPAQCNGRPQQVTHEETDRSYVAGAASSCVALPLLSQLHLHHPQSSSCQQQCSGKCPLEVQCIAQQTEALQAVVAMHSQYHSYTFTIHSRYGVASRQICAHRVIVLDTVSMWW